MKPEKLIQLKPEEEILQVVHEAITPNIPRFIGFVVLLALPFFFLFPLFREGLFGVTIFFVVLIIGIVLTSRAFFKWSRTVLIVTDKRVVDHEQSGFFTRVITEARYKQLDEVICRIKGISPTLFRYGTVRMHLSGNAADIEFRRISSPERVTDLINDLREEYPD